jgi:hypothetical protein
VGDPDGGKLGSRHRELAFCASPGRCGC